MTIDERKHDKQIARQKWDGLDEEAWVMSDGHAYVVAWLSM